jgi:hypothetical protein
MDLVQPEYRTADNMTMNQRAVPKPANLTDKHYRRSAVLFAAMVLTALVLKALLLPRWPIHQDEFYYLSAVYDYERATPMQSFMTLQVHLFGWLPVVGQNEVAQVVAARIVMYLLLLGTCFYLFRTARHFLGVRGALFCVLCYLSFLFTVANGASFRSDTPATFFFMLALYHFVAREDAVFSNVLAGAAMAVSLLFTIKAAIYLPVLAGWFLLRRLPGGGRTKSIVRTACFLAALIFSFITLYKLHAATLARFPSGNGAGFLGRVFSMFVTFGQIFPAWEWILQTLLIDSLIWSLLLAGLVVHVIDLLKHTYARNDPRAYLLVFSIPLLSLLVYRNAYPYFFVFLVPTATLFCGYAFERLARRLQNAKRITVPVLSAALGLLVCGNFIIHFPRYAWSGWELTKLQRDVLATIHTMFPEPVSYVDKCSMVASYPKVGPYMSVADMSNYLRRAEPVMDELLTRQKPRFLLANSILLDLRSSEPPRSAGGQALLDADWTALKSYFIHHWGPVWVAGKQFNLGPAADRRQFQIILPGPYTVESQTEVFIDGTSCRDGDVVQLEEGTHTIEAGGAAGMMRLRWGDHLYRPDSEPQETNLLGPFL